MQEPGQATDQEIFRFIYDKIDSVPHLEALLLIWENSPGPWSVDDLAQRLYIDRNSAMSLLQDLTRQNLIVLSPTEPEHYLYESQSTENDRLIAALHAKYRIEIVAVSTMIHRKASSAVRDFAEAFRFTKERT